MAGNVHYRCVLATFICALPLVSEMKPRRWGLPSQTATSAAAAWFCRTMPFVNRPGHDVSWRKALVLVRDPVSGDLHGRFDERDMETEPWSNQCASARLKSREK